MDIYQIWTTYNKQWSRYEILAFTGVLILVCTAMAVCVHRKKLNIIQAAAVLALVVFLGIVFGSTVFTRTGTIRQYELVPFWSWRDIIRYHDWTLLKENLLNCILLLPAGVLLPIIANHKVKWYQALAVGILVSAIIEVSQLIFMRGLFEWDDMIHNCIYRPDRAHCTAFQCMASADTVHAFRSSVHDDYSGIGIPASVNRASSSSTLSSR